MLISQHEITKSFDQNNQYLQILSKNEASTYQIFEKTKSANTIQPISTLYI
jgi:hypothetical protein